jgi:hypothetical protein
MIEYPNDKLYRRVSNLLIELKDIASKKRIKIKPIIMKIIYSIFPIITIFEKLIIVK